MNLLRSLACLLALGFSALAAVKEAPDPAKLKDKVSVTLGQNLAVQFTPQGDSLIAPKIVEKPGDKTPVVTFDFQKKSEFLALTTKNPYQKTLTFRALLRLKGRTDYRETSILPIAAGLLSFETWQDPIEEIVLFDFKLSDDKR